MEYDINGAPVSGPQYAPSPYQTDNMYMTGYRRNKWIWIVIAAVIVCAAVITAFAVLGGKNDSNKLKGNAGVVALFEFFRQQQENGERLTGGVAKEIGMRILEEPFEIDAEMEMRLDDTEEFIIPLTSVTIGIKAKYDMKDLGVKINALGMEAVGAYLIEDNVVLSLMGRTGSTPVKLEEKDLLKKSMGLGERIKALMPFLPEDDGLFFELLETLSLSVPDSCTKTDSMRVYSPKEDKDVKMDVITTTLDAKAIRKTVTSFRNKLEDNRKLSREVQKAIDDFTDFFGIDSFDFNKKTEELQKLADSEEFDDGLICWSVYIREGGYIGMKLEVTGKDTVFSYTLMSEYSGNENFYCVKSQMDGAGSESFMHTVWNGNKVQMSGEINTIVSPDTGNMTQIIDGKLEYLKKSGNEYAVTGNFTFEGNAYNDILNNADSMSYDMDIDASMEVGAGLGTLKESREWDGIYKKEWGSMEEMFGWMLPSGLIPYIEDGNNL